MNFISFSNTLLSYRADFIFFAFICLMVPALIQTRMRKFYKTSVPFSTWILVVVFICAGGILAEIAAGTEKANLKRLIGGFAPTYASELEKSGHAKIGFGTSPDDPLYLALIEKEIRWEKLNPSIQDVYTFRKLPGGELGFVVDSETDYDRSGKYEGGRESRTAIGEIFDHADHSIDRAYAGETRFDPQPYTDRWGTWVSAYAPLFDARGKVEAVLGVDYAASDWIFGVLLYRLTALALVSIPILILIASSAVLALLKTSEVKFRSLVSNIPGAIYRVISKPAPVFEFFSDGIFEITGCPASYFMGNSTRFYEDIIFPEDKEIVRKKIEKALAKRRPYAVEYRARGANNETRWIQEQGQGVYDLKKNLLWQDGALFDITRHKQLEEHYFKAQKIESIGQLAGGIAHDFNNLLTVISGYAEFRLQVLEKDDPLRNDFEEIAKAGRRAALLTDRLAAYSGRQMVQPSIFDLNVFISTLEKVLNDFCGENIKLMFRLIQSEINVRINAGQMEQILVNVLRNSRDAMPGGGEVVIETRREVIHAEDSELSHELKAGSYAVLTVRDSGTGMSEEIKEHIFEPFFTRKFRNKDSGMGLSIVYGIIRQAKGHIAVQSTAGKGTTVEIYLPEVKKDAVREIPAAPVPEKTRTAETILVVEDEEVIRNLTADILKQSGYQILKAENGENALQVASSFEGNIDLLFTDVVMPKMGGKKLAESLKSLRPKTKVLFASGYTDGDLTESGVIDPAIYFIPKPYSFESLNLKIRQVLDA